MAHYTYMFNEYAKKLFKTYRLFFASAKSISILLIILLPLQAILPLAAVQAGQGIINHIVSHDAVIWFFVMWLVATLLVQVLPTIALLIQGILTDKLTGFINIKLMNKSRDLKSLNIFDNS